MKENPLDAAGGAALLVLVVGIFYGLVKMIAPKGQAGRGHVDNFSSVDVSDRCRAGVGQAGDGQFGALLFS